jgi:osmotically-inducible protein OsmY
MRRLTWMILPALIAFGSMAMADEASDKEITKQVRAVFKQHPDVCTGVGARAKDGIVYLTGSTSTPLERKNAEELTRGVPGVKQVVNEVYAEN